MMATISGLDFGLRSLNFWQPDDNIIIYVMAGLYALGVP